jgi:hypothetical protein
MRILIYCCVIIIGMIFIIPLHGYENRVVIDGPDLAGINPVIWIPIKIENDFDIGRFNLRFRLTAEGPLTACFMDDIEVTPGSRLDESLCSEINAEVDACLHLDVWNTYDFIATCIPPGPLEEQFKIRVITNDANGMICIDSSRPSLSNWRWCYPEDEDCMNAYPPPFEGDCIYVDDGPNFVIRDCIMDFGLEDNCTEYCGEYWFTSPDIWLGPYPHIELFCIPQEQTLFQLNVAVWNNGQPSTEEAGLYLFSSDELASATFSHIMDTKYLASIGHAPAPAGSVVGPVEGHYAMFTSWGTISPDYNLHVLISNTEDPVLELIVPLSNNYACYNKRALAYLPIGKGFGPHSSFTAYFNDTVYVTNPYDYTSDFLLTVEDLGPDWQIIPADGIELTLDSGEVAECPYYFLRDNAQHGLDTFTNYLYYHVPDSTLLDGRQIRLRVDGIAPDSLPYFEVRLVDMPDSCQWPVYEINWDTPTLDTLGYPELLQGFEIHGSTDSFDLHSPDSTTLIVRTNADLNFEQDDFQYYYIPPDSQVYYITMFALDAAGHTSKSTPILTGYEYNCGDCNDDGVVNVSDAVYIINYVFVGGDPPYPLYTGDVNCDAFVNISDAVWIINYVFVGGNAPCDTTGDGIADC